MTFNNKLAQERIAKAIKSAARTIAKRHVFGEDWTKSEAPGWMDEAFKLEIEMVKDEIWKAIEKC